MLQLTLNIKDRNKVEFFLELLKRMKFVEIVNNSEVIDLEIDSFVNEIYQDREKSATELTDKLNTLFDSLETQENFS